MASNQEWLYELLYPQRDNRGRRFTQDTPILADVWLALAESGGRSRVDVLINPHNKEGVGGLLRGIQERLSKPENQLAYNESHVVVRVNLEEILTILLPQSIWWQRMVHQGSTEGARSFLETLAPKARLTFEQWRDRIKSNGPSHPAVQDLKFLVQIASAVIVGNQRARNEAKDRPSPDFAAAGLVLRNLLLRALQGVPEGPTLWTISRNRSAVACLWRSRETIKGDAALRVFNVKCDQVCWGIIDTGIDARHPAFSRQSGDKGEIRSRVIKTYDFTRLRVLFSTQPTEAAMKKLPWLAHLTTDRCRQITLDLRERLLHGMQIDWDMIEPALEVPHDFELEKAATTRRGSKKAGPKKKVVAKYEPPPGEHGTHVAGILGADWRHASVDTADVVVKDVYDLMNLSQLNAGQVLKGVCPDIQLYDLRVFTREGDGDEFAILAALQFVRYLNSSKSKRVIHGVNISVSMEHDVRIYACGRTPICDECERATGSGLVVVAAAGNTGFDEREGAFASSYRQSSITDPGNADSVITVGSTHREMPHTYGVSYFSSRGFTGDGRAKPDLVAPGERIFSCVPNNLAATLDGTSMAAPHVSGAAALLMARHIELMGQPARIKKILCSTATDLGRVPQYQGAGLVDVLRALESV